MEPFSGARLPCLQRTWTQNTVQPFAPCPLGEYCKRQLQTKSLAFQRFYNCNIETNYWLCFGALSTRSHLVQYRRDCFFLFSELCLIHNWKKKVALFTFFFSVLKILPVHRKDSIFCTRVTPPGRGRSHSLPSVWEKQGDVLANFQRSHSLSQSQTHPARPDVQSITGNFFWLTFSPVFQFFMMQKLLLTFGLYKNRQLAWIRYICHGSLSPVVDSEALLWVLMFIWTVRKEKSRWRISGNPKEPLAPSEPRQRPCDPGVGRLAVPHRVWETKIC